MPDFKAFDYDKEIVPMKYKDNSPSTLFLDNLGDAHKRDEIQELRAKLRAYEHLIEEIRQAIKELSEGPCRKQAD